MSSRTVATAATMFSAFIFPPHVSVVFAAERGTAPHVGYQRGKCEQGECEVQQVDHGLLIARVEFIAHRNGSHDTRAPVKAAQRSRRGLQRFHKAVAAGSLSSNTDPPPCRSLYLSVPLWASASRRAMESPSPAEPASAT